MLKAAMTSLFATSLLLFAAQSAWAEDPPTMPQGKNWCQENPEKCLEMREKRKAWCAEHPEECEKMKQKRAERKAWCEKNPQECAKQREERRRKMEEMKAKCQADPAWCEKKKQQMRDHHEDHMHMHGDGPKSGMPAQPAPGTGSEAKPKH